MQTLTVGEWFSIALAVASLLLLLRAVRPDLASGDLNASAQWVFLPHIVLIALIVCGLRRFALVLQSLILIAGAILALGVVLDSAMGHHSGSGYGIVAALQVPLFALCFRSGRTPFAYADLNALGPRLALGVLAGVGCWFAAGVAVTAAAAPVRARDAAIIAGRQREAVKREAYARADVLTACLQMSPASADSLPYFPASLGELPTATCPEGALPAPEGFVIEYSAGPADSAGKRRTFHLSIHDSVVSDSIETYESDESMIVRGIHGRGPRRYPIFAPEPMAVLNRIGRCIEAARDTLTSAGSESYPASAAEVQRRRQCEYGMTADSSAFRIAGNRASWIVRYQLPARPHSNDAPGGFTLLLQPARNANGRGIGGALVSLFSDSAGTIHMTRRPRAATVQDPPIPDCRELAYPGNDPLHPCREYRPRQRWGLTNELPTIVLSFSGTGTLGIGERFTLLPHYQALLPRDSATEVRVRWDSGGRDTVLARRRGAPFGKPIGNGVYFEFRHTWADTGMKRVEVHVLTAGHEDFEAHHHIHVLAARR